MQRIERGDMGCAIGAVFEAAAIVGVRLFDMDLATIIANVAIDEQKLTLLPQAVRRVPTVVNDDF